MVLILLVVLIKNYDVY